MVALGLRLALALTLSPALAVTLPLPLTPGRVYTCALDEGAVARAFGDCRDPLGPAPSSPLGGEALAPAETVEAYP